jgi:hypothetical protein
MNGKTLAVFVGSDCILDAVPDAPRLYAASLTKLVAEGYAELLPMGVKGRPSGERAEILNSLDALYSEHGVTSKKARTQRITRLTYALAILAANGRRDGEEDEAYIRRCATIRKIANDGDMATIEKALKGSTERKGRGTKGPKSGRTTGRKGGTTSGKGGETPETPKTVDPAERYQAAHNALIAAISEFGTAHAEYVKGGGKVTKAAATAITTRARVLITELTA